MLRCHSFACCKWKTRSSSKNIGKVFAHLSGAFIVEVLLRLSAFYVLSKGLILWAMSSISVTSLSRGLVTASAFLKSLRKPVEESNE